MSGKATLFRFKFLSSCLKFFLLSFIVLLFLGQSVELPAQVIIKERVSIYPNSTPPITLDGVISGDPHNPVYLRYGGNVNVILIHPGSQSSLGYTTQFWEENLGLVAANKSQYDTLALGYFPQWKKLTFWITELNNPETKYYPHRVLSDEIINPNDIQGLTNDIWFFIPPIPDDSISNYPIRVWRIDLTRDDNYAAMPPPEILDYFGNPFVPSEEIIIPADGTVYMTVEDVNSNVLIDLYQDMPDNQLLLSDLGSNEGETINFGRKSAGDRMRFYIQSGHTVVNGMNLYPKTYDDEFYSYFDGSILFKDLWFEDWTDLLFDNLNCSVYLIPDHYADFPWSLDVELSPSVISPGDTAQVILRWRNPDGSLENFPDSLIFDVEIMSGYEYGNLFSPDIPFNFDWYYGLTQGFSFVAVDTIDVDSVWVSIWVGKSGGIISGVSQGKPTAMVAQQSDQVRIKKFKDREKPIVNKQSLLKLGNTDNTGGMGYTIEDVEYPPFFMGIGEVLITKPDAHEILLGETKYYQAKLEDEKLKIEELTEPQIKGGIADTSVWGDSALTAVSGKKLGVYYDKKLAIMQSDTFPPIMNDLPAGLVRLIGRFWEKDSTYKVKLTAKHEEKTASIEIEVVRPDTLGDAPYTVIGPDTYEEDKTYNLDSLIIDYAGKEGILPQIVKGIIKNESKDFYPSYRYEPFADMTNVQVNFDSTHRYWIRSETELGDPPIPQHNNLKDALGPLNSYPGYKTVWDYYNEKNELYGRKIYDRQQKKWEEYRVIHEEILKLQGLDSTLAADSSKILADTSYVHWLRDEIGGKGMKGTIAQTRIAASYGLMQLTYYNGIKAFRGKYKKWGYNYPDSSAQYLPEFINIHPIGLRYGILHFKGKLRFALGPIKIYESTWKNGIEEYYWWGLKGYNGSKEYPNPVFDFSKNYLPKIKKKN